MGKHDYKQDAIIKVRLDRAIKHLCNFMDENYINSIKPQFKLHLRTAICKAGVKLVNYQIDKKVNMEKVELLRDVVFLGSSLMETTSQNHIYFKSLISACFDIVELGANIRFDDDFIKKIASSKNEFMTNTDVNSVPLYYLFKSHFRYSKIDN